MLFKGFGSTNKESVAELFVTLMSKLLSVESLWEHGLCASNFEASWISKTWKKGVGNLSVEDFLDRSQNFARAVGKTQMQKICGCLLDCTSNLTDFMKGHIDASKLKTRLFGCLNPDDLVSRPRPRRGKRNLSPEGRHRIQQRTKRAVQLQHKEPSRQADAASASAPATVTSPVLHRRAGTQSNVTQFVRKPWWPFIIVPSGFGYGLSIRLPPRAPHPARGILGRAPGDLIRSNSGIQLPKQGPLLPKPPRETSADNCPPCSGGDEQLQHNEQRR